MIVEAERDETALVVRVTDNGPGIPTSDSRACSNGSTASTSRARARRGHGHRPGHREAPGGAARGKRDGGFACRRRGGVHGALATAVVGHGASEKTATETQRSQRLHFFLSSCHRGTERTESHSTSPAAKRPRAVASRPRGSEPRPVLQAHSRVAVLVTAPRHSAGSSSASHTTKRRTPCVSSCELKLMSSPTCLPLAFRYASTWASNSGSPRSTLLISTTTASSTIRSSR